MFVVQQVMMWSTRCVTRLMTLGVWPQRRVRPVLSLSRCHAAWHPVMTLAPSVSSLPGHEHHQSHTVVSKQRKWTGIQLHFYIDWRDKTKCGSTSNFFTLISVLSYSKILIRSRLKTEMCLPMRVKWVVPIILCLFGVFQSRERGVTHYPRPVMVTTISMWPGHNSFCCFRFPISGSDLNTDSAGSGHSRLRPAQIITVITRPGQHQPLMNEISTSRWISFPCLAQNHQYHPQKKLLKFRVSQKTGCFKQL